MSKERRVSERKECAMPLRFRVVASGDNAPSATAVNTADRLSPSRIPSFLGVLDGEAVNLSERGMYFRSRQQVNIGDPLEMYFTVPRELTGRDSEQVRCHARVVHVEQTSGKSGSIGVGVLVERFEPIRNVRNWGN